jgi:hypothetical protein
MFEKTTLFIIIIIIIIIIIGYRNSTNVENKIIFYAVCHCGHRNSHYRGKRIFRNNIRQALSGTAKTAVLVTSGKHSVALLKQLYW